jgi:hypothetical protein
MEKLDSGSTLILNEELQSDSETIIGPINKTYPTEIRKWAAVGAAFLIGSGSWGSLLSFSVLVPPSNII